MLNSRKKKVAYCSGTARFDGKPQTKKKVQESMLLCSK